MSDIQTPERYLMRLHGDESEKNRTTSQLIPANPERSALCHRQPFHQGEVYCVIQLRDGRLFTGDSEGVTLYRILCLFLPSSAGIALSC